MPIFSIERRIFNPDPGVPQALEALASGSAFDASIFASVAAGVALGSGIASGVTLGAATWQTLRNGLVGGSYLAGIDVMSNGDSTVGVSPDFDSIKTVVFNNTTNVTDILGVVTSGFQPGHTYYAYELAFNYTPPTSTGTVTFFNCRFIGFATNAQHGTVGTALIRAFNTGHARVEVYDCTFRPQTPNPVVNGISGYNFLVRRCDLSYVCDGFTTFRGSSDSPNGDSLVDIQQTYVHHLAWFSKAQCTALGISSQNDGTHNDCWQHEGGINPICKYNTFEGYTAAEFFNNFYDASGNTNSCIIYQTDLGFVTGGTIEFNLLAGGRAQINYTVGAQGPLNNVGTFKSNRHRRDFTVKSILRPSISAFTCDFGSGSTANTYTDDNSVVPQTNSGQ